MEEIFKFSSWISGQQPIQNYQNLIFPIVFIENYTEKWKVIPNKNSWLDIQGVYLCIKI